MRILSAVQFCPQLARSHAEVMGNFKRLEPLVNECAQLGSELVVFPELALTGYSFFNQDEALAVAETRDGKTFQKMRQVASYLSAYVAWGYVEFDPETELLHNSATLVDPNGTPISWVRKINLWSQDFLWAAPGESAAPIVETELGLMSLVICRDLRDKIPGNIPRKRIGKKTIDLFDGQKVDIVAACTNWGKGGYPATTWMDFAVENKCSLVLSNRWGKEESPNGHRMDFGQGGSCIIEKDWTVHTVGIKFNSDCVVTMSSEK